MNKIEENTSKSGPMAEKEQKRSCEVSITITQGDVNNVTMDLDALLSDLDKVAQQAAENDGQNSLQHQHQHQTEMRGGAGENPPRENQLSYLRSALLASEDIGDFPEGFPTRPRNCTHHVIPFSLFNEDLVRRFPANLYVKRQLITKYGDPSCATAASEASPMPVTTFKGQANQSHPMMSVGVIAEEIPSLLSSTAYRKYGYEKKSFENHKRSDYYTFKFPAFF